jgi:hypothetical protein
MAEAGFTKVSGPIQIPQSALVVSNYVFSKPKFTFKVDVFLSTTEWDRVSLSRRIKIRFGRRKYWMTTAEDLLLYKLMAWRKRDVDDAASIIERSGESMDWDYVKSWVGRLRVKTALSQLLRDMGRND